MLFQLAIVEQLQHTDGTIGFHQGLPSTVHFDADGLDPSERRYLALLRESSQPIPLGRLSRMLGTSVSTLIEHIEPFLFRRGLVHMTPNGREAANVRRFSKTREAANVRRLACLPAAALN